MKKTLSKSFLVWLPFAAVITFACMLGYLLVQQDLRQNANDPQVQIAEDISQAINSGSVSPMQIIPPGQTVDIATSLDPYIMIFDSTGKVIASSAMLAGQVPNVPVSVFSEVTQHGEDRITWQPQFGVRGALVIDKYNGNASSTGGFVLAGRSLREVEIREENMLHITLLAWILGLIVMFAIVWIGVWGYKKKNVD